MEPGKGQEVGKPRLLKKRVELLQAPFLPQDEAFQDLLGLGGKPLGEPLSEDLPKASPRPPIPPTLSAPSAFRTPLDPWERSQARWSSPPGLVRPSGGAMYPLSW
ncbi:hypothetical protein YIM1640_06710 [Thermus oshimai]